VDLVFWQSTLGPVVAILEYMCCSAVPVAVLVMEHENMLAAFGEKPQSKKARFTSEVCCHQIGLVVSAL
jgi:hypothetical protein